MAELEKFNPVSSPQPFNSSQREYGFNPTFSTTFYIDSDSTPETINDPLLRTIPNLIALRRGSVSAECLSSPDGSYPSLLTQEEPKGHYPKSEESVALIRKAISSNILFRELDENQLMEIVF